MTALTSDTNFSSKNRLGSQWFTAAQGAVIKWGSLVMLDANGLAVRAAAGSNTLQVIGRAESSLDGTEAEGARVEVARGTFFVNLASSHGITQATVGKVVYADTDNEIHATQGTRPVAGVLEALELGGAWIRCDVPAAISASVGVDSTARASAATADGKAVFAGATVITTNAIAALSAPEQALISTGTIVKSTVGGVTTYFRYISGSKTSEASYASWGGDPTIGNTTGNTAGNTVGNTVGNTTGNTTGNTAGGDAAAAALKQLTAYTYKFSRDGGVVGAIPMTLERGTALAATGRITKAWFETSGLASGTSAATVALSAESAGDILVAAVIGTLSAFNDGIPANSAATSIVSTAAVPSVAIAVEDLTAGKVRLYIEWLPAIAAL